MQTEHCDPIAANSLARLLKLKSIMNNNNYQFIMHLFIKGD